jgi:hypothetical protein
VEEWRVLYEDALQHAHVDAATEDKIRVWALLCTFGPPSDGFPLRSYPDLPVEDDFWEAPVEGTTIIARYLVVTSEQLLIVKDFT